MTVENEVEEKRDPPSWEKNVLLVLYVRGRIRRLQRTAGREVERKKVEELKAKRRE